MGLETQLDKQMVQHMVFEHELHIAPTVLIIARLRKIIGIEDTSIERLTGFVSRFGFLKRLQVLNRIIDIETYMDTGSEMAYDELRLDRYTCAETVGKITLFQISLAEMSDRRIGERLLGAGNIIAHGTIIAVIECIYTSSDTEDRDGHPVSRRFDRSRTEKLHIRIVVAVIILLHASRSTDLHRPWFIHAVI